MYMAFVTFTLPTIIKAMRDASDSIPRAVRNLDLSSDDEEDSCANGDLETVNNSLKRMEVEVLNMRDDLVDRVEAALQEKPENIEIKLGKRIDNLENL